MAHIVMLLTNGFSSDPRVEKEAAALVGAGYRVTVLAWDREGKLPLREECGGVSIERLGPRASFGAGLSSLPRFREFWAALENRVVELAPDAIHAHDLDTAVPAGRAVKALGSKTRLVQDMHELYPESAMVPQTGAKGALARGATRWLERRAVKACDMLIVAPPALVPYYERMGAAEKIVRVENAPEKDLFSSRPPRPDRPFTVGFIGQKRFTEELFVLMDAVDRTPGTAALLAGGGPGEETVARTAAGREHIEVLGRYIYSELAGLYERIDAVHAVYDASLGNVRIGFPNKVMEAMAAGIPMIVAEGTWLADFVRSEGVGEAVPERDVDALAAVIARFAADPEESRRMGERGKALIEAGLNWEAAAGRLVAGYDRLLA